MAVTSTTRHDGRRDDLLHGGLTRDCPVCGRGTLVPTECAEGHGDDCPDRLCLDCGAALFVDPVAEPGARSA